MSKTTDGRNEISHISTINSSTLNLTAGQSFVGEFENVEHYAVATLLVIVGAAESGTLTIKQSIDIKNSVTKSYAISANDPKEHTIPIISRYFQLTLDADQGTNLTGAIQVIYHENQSNGLIEKAGDIITNDTDCSVSKTILQAMDQNGTYVPIISDETGGLEPYYPYDNVGAKATYDHGVGVISHGRRITGNEVIGNSETVYLNQKKSCVPLLQGGEFIKMPSVDTFPIITSTSIRDSQDQTGTAQGGTTTTIILQAANGHFTGLDDYKDWEITLGGDKSGTYLVTGSTAADPPTLTFTPALATPPTVSTTYTIDGLGAKQVLIQGWSDTGVDNNWVVAVDLFNLNGQNPSTSLFGTSFVRFIGARVMEAGLSKINTLPIPVDENSRGDMYITDGGATIVNGIPTDRNECLMTARAGDGVFYSGYAVIPPKMAGVFSEHIIGVSGASNSVVVIASYFLRTSSVNSSTTQETGWSLGAILDARANRGATSAHQIFAFPVSCC